MRKIKKKKSPSLNNIAFNSDCVTSATLSRIENGLVDFKFSTLINLSRTLDIPLSELLMDFKPQSNLDE